MELAPDMGRFTGQFGAISNNHCAAMLIAPCSQAVAAIACLNQNRCISGANRVEFQGYQGALRGVRDEDYIRALGIPQDLPEISEAAHDRIASSIANQTIAPISTALLDCAAYFYFLDRARAGTGRGLKSDVQKLRTHTSALAAGLQRAPLSIPLFLGIIGALLQPQEPKALARIKRLGADAAWLDGLIARALGAIGGPLPQLDIGPGISLEILMSVYERATGKKPTHSTHKDGEYVGGARSPFGALAIAFFHEVDPSLSKNRIGNMIRKRLHRGQRKR